MKPDSTFRHFGRTAARWHAVAVIVFAASAAYATNLVPAARQTNPVLLTGAMVVTVSGATHERADVLLVDGKIAQIAPTIAAPAGAEVIDVKGKRVYPGFIAAQTVLGLVEISSARQTVDSAETGTINPNARTQTALNPDSELLPVARANGVLTALAVPAEKATGAAKGNLIAGTSTLIRLDGWTWEDLTVRASVGMHVYWPAMRLNRDAKNETKPFKLTADSINTKVRGLMHMMMTMPEYQLA